MHDNIYKRAREFNQRALKDRIEGKGSHSLLGLATAAELLGKSYLAKTHPCLIIDGRDFDSLLHVVGAGAHSKRSPHDLRTIMAADVYTRCSQLLPKLLPMAADMRALAGVRNGIVHLGEHDAEVAEKVLAPYARYSKLLLEALGVKFEDYFAEFSELVAQCIDGSAKAVNVKVEALLIKATAAYAERFGGMEAGLKDAVIKTIVSSYRLTKYDEELVKCPACGNDAVASGTNELVRWEADFDRDGTPEGGSPVVELFVESLLCAVCNLELKTSDEVEAAGLDTVIELENVDPADFAPEPDYEHA